jgi:glycine/D-amino acid oxidase-like deaminating enzyme
VRVVGFAPEVYVFFWFGGLGGGGLQTSPAIARIVASLIAGIRWSVGDVTPAEISPTRFLGHAA